MITPEHFRLNDKVAIGTEVGAQHWARRRRGLRRLWSQVSGQRHPKTARRSKLTSLGAIKSRGERRLLRLR